MADLDHDYTAARPHLLRIGLSALLLLAAAACGGDDASAKPADTSKGGAGGGGNQGGASGNAGAGGSGVAMPAPVECGSTMCYPRMNPLAGIIGMAGPGLGNLLPMSYPCCVDADKGACGTSMSMSGGTCEPPAVADSRCPGLNLGAAAGALGGAGMMSGCCLDNQCGQDGSLFGRGCVENSQVKSMISAVPLIGTLAMVPPALACDRPMEMMPTKPTKPDDRDAGADDAGH